MENPAPLPPHEAPVGPSAAIIIVILLIALGGIYFLVTEKERFHRPPVQQNVNV